jgi:hypothetical protein
MGINEAIATDPNRWARTQAISESIAASRRVLAIAETRVRRARAAVSRADAVLRRIDKLCAPYPVVPPRDTR